MNGASVSVTGMGRHLRSPARIKHNVKRIDRLVGNQHLHNERKPLYTTMSHWLLKSIEQPLILIDWSPFSKDGKQQLLRAAIPVGGRSMTLYEELHPAGKLGNREVQHRFLATLHSMLSPHCRPITIADSGFRVPFYLKNACREREPWLLVTSCSLSSYSAACIVKLYKSRMQIEENFRDTKSASYGLGAARENRTTLKRAENLLLISALATVILWANGAFAIAQKLHRLVSINSSSKRPSYSVIYTARLLIKYKRLKLPASCINKIQKHIQRYTHELLCQ